MAQCTYFNVDEAKAFLQSNPNASNEEAMEFARCKNDAAPNHTRCEEHGYGDVLFKYSADLREDERSEFVELYNNIQHTYNLDDGNLFVNNIVAMCCKEIVMSRKAEPAEMVQHIRNAVALGRDLAITPKEQRGEKIVVHSDKEGDIKDIEAIVQARMESTKEP